MLTPVSMQASTATNYSSKNIPPRTVEPTQRTKATISPPQTNPLSLVNIGRSMLFLLLGASASLAGGSTSSTAHLKGSSLPSGTSHENALVPTPSTTLDSMHQAFITPKTQSKGSTPQQIAETTNRFEELGNVITAISDGKVYAKTCGFSAEEISEAMTVLVAEANLYFTDDFSSIIEIHKYNGGDVSKCTTNQSEYTESDLNDCVTQINTALQSGEVKSNGLTDIKAAVAIQSYATENGVVTIVTDGDECAITLSPTLQPSLSPTTTSPSQAPSTAPSYTTSEAPSSSPSTTPSLRPTGAPTIIKSDQSSNKNWEEKAEQFFKDNAPFIAGVGTGSLMTALIIAILR